MTLFGGNYEIDCAPVNFHGHILRACCPNHFGARVVSTRSTTTNQKPVEFRALIRQSGCCGLGQAALRLSVRSFGQHALKMRPIEKTVIGPKGGIQVIPST
jgi:hypothetical protein